jgi:PAS domain S-box-containing protein
MSPEALRVLVVDDVLDYAEMVVQFIRTSDAWHDVETATAGSYDQAVRILTDKPFDVAFIDYRLGARDGVALLREVRAKGVATPVVILTGHGDEHVAVEAMKAGAADYLGKMQVSVDALDRAIRHALALGAEEQQRRQAEAALRANERRFRALVENSSDTLLLIDAAARVQFASSSSERHLGWTVDQMRGHSLLDFLHSDDHAGVTAQMADRLHTPGASATVEARVRHADGQFRIMELLFVNRFDEPSVNAIVVTARDVTDRRRLEDRLQHAQRIEAVGQLAGGVAHDFNNLLTVILGYCNLILEDLPHDDPLRQDLAEIRSAGDKALSLTRQLLAFGRRQMLQPQIVDLNLLVRQLERLLRRLVAPQTDVASRLAADLAPVRVDPSSMEQVLVNLAANARDVMPSGGRLTIETVNVDVDPTTSRDGIMPIGPYVLLAVYDTGPAMDDETRARIFEPFFTWKDHGKTDGLGLATVYGIVKQNGGFIWADPGASSGTTFRIYLPRADVAARDRGRDVAPKPCWETVLLVEDEAALRALLREVLRRQGYTVLEARHGVDALRAAERHRDDIHLLIANFGMDRMSGRELAERLQRDRPALKVLLLLGYGEPDPIGAGEFAGAAATLRKPFTPDMLVHRVRALLDRSGPSEVRSSAP